MWFPRFLILLISEWFQLEASSFSYLSLEVAVVIRAPAMSSLRRKPLRGRCSVWNYSRQYISFDQYFSRVLLLSEFHDLEGQIGTSFQYRAFSSRVRRTSQADMEMWREWSTQSSIWMSIRFERNCLLEQYVIATAQVWLDPIIVSECWKKKKNKRDAIKKFNLRHVYSHLSLCRIRFNHQPQLAAFFWLMDKK